MIPWVTHSFVWDEISGLATRGIEVHVDRFMFKGSKRVGSISIYDLSKKIDPLILTELFKRAQSYPLLSLFRNPRRVYGELLYNNHIEKVLSVVKPDILHAHFAYPEGWASYLALRRYRKRIPFVVTLHGYNVLVEPSLGYGIRLKRRYDLLVRRVVEVADAVIVASHALYDEVARLINDKEKIHLIPHGVDLERFKPDLNANDLRESLGGKDKLIVFTAKAFEPVYGLEYLILVAGIVAKLRNDVVFVIAGDGSQRPYYLNLVKRLGIEQYVIFPGRLPRSEVPYYVASVVVVPSLQESWGLVATEAMACGEPVIASRVGGLIDQVIDGVNGFLVLPRDLEAIAKKYYISLKTEK
jgi:glycosyltransferase involved in cell wall biosynthesis